MKTNIMRRIVTAVCLLSCICIYSCQKDVSSSTPGSTNANAATSADDQQQVSNESDLTTNDANTALSGQSSFSGDNGSSASSSGTVEVNSVNAQLQTNSLINVHQLICDATITYDTVNSQRVITIVYDGTNCWGNRTRTGTVIITMPVGVYWRDAGATATITVDTLSITRKRDNKTVVINGTKTITNVSGGLIKDLATLQTITHTISGSFTVGFQSGKTATWNVSKNRVFTYDNGVVLTTTGTHSDGTNSNIAEWGTDRFGDAFASQITAAKVIRQDCDYRLVSGQNTVTTNNGVSVITYGLDSNGDATGCPGSGTYYFKLVFTSTNGKIYTIIWPY